MYRITLSSHEDFTIPLMQYDSNYEIRVGTVESLKYKTVKIEIQTAIGGVLQCPADIIDDYIVRFWVDTQITWKSGSYKAQIVVYNTDDLTKVVSYYPFTLEVTPSVKTHYDDPYETAKQEVDQLVNEGYKIAESWAHGGTDTRDGEDTDNAKYWSQISESWAIGGTTLRSGENTNNSKYYAEMAKGAYEDIADTKEAALSNRITALESGVDSDPVTIGTITHELDDYPTVDFYIGQYGAGLGGAGETPAGGTAMTHVNSMLTQDDKNNITISVSSKVLKDADSVALTPSEINQVNDHVWAVTFKNSDYNGMVVLR